MCLIQRQKRGVEGTLVRIFSTAETNRVIHSHTYMMLYGKVPTQATTQIRHAHIWVFMVLPQHGPSTWSSHSKYWQKLTQHPRQCCYHLPITYHPCIEGTRQHINSPLVVLLFLTLVGHFLVGDNAAIKKCFPSRKLHSFSSSCKAYCLSWIWHSQTKKGLECVASSTNI